MHVYITTDFEAQTLAVHGTLDAAHADVRRCAGRVNLRIELWDVPTDKGAILNLLALAAMPDPIDPYRPGANPGSTLKRVWDVTERGGLRETDPQEV